MTSKLLLEDVEALISELEAELTVLHDAGEGRTDAICPCSCMCTCCSCGPSHHC